MFVNIYVQVKVELCQIIDVMPCSGSLDLWIIFVLAYIVIIMVITAIINTDTIHDTQYFNLVQSR
jgi:hypothetical protein